MDITLAFISNFFILLWLISPIVVVLVLMIMVLGHIIGRLENWSRVDTTYYTCITATTVGYGDFPPTHRRSKIAAIFIAFLGLILTGIVVAIALNSLSSAIEGSNRLQKALQKHPSSRLQPAAK